MRRRSGAILAENINDYFSQMNILSKKFEISNSNNELSYKLFDFDYLSLNDNNLTFEENDLLSSKKTYRICLRDITKKFKNIHQKRVLILSKIKKNQKKKRRLIIKSEYIPIHN